MLLFWILAGLISSGAALLILLRAARAGGEAAPLDPTLEVYRRQLSEIDELAERGLLGPDERRAAHAEAGRRLLGEAEHAPDPATDLKPRAARTLVLAAAIAAPLLALGAYLMIGKPGLPDMPYQKRLKSWEMVSRSDPSRLGLPEMAAVLASAAKAKPNDPQPAYYLGVVERAEGDLDTAIRHLQRSLELDPRNPKVWATLGVALVEQGQGKVGPDAVDAFRHAAELDPAAVQPRYFLARADIGAGHIDAGLSVWRAIEAGLPAQDPRRAELQQEIDQVARTGKLEAPAPAEAQGGPQPGQADQQAAFIQSMVDRLAARLKAQPNDPEGWARLIRAYGVLHEADKRSAAILEAQRLFKDRPADLRTALQGETAAAPPPTPPG
jgi:cytochrome c-type biogenesis protein CcmH